MTTLVTNVLFWVTLWELIRGFGFGLQTGTLTLNKMELQAETPIFSDGLVQVGDSPTRTQATPTPTPHTRADARALTRARAQTHPPTHTHTHTAAFLTDTTFSAT